MLNLCRNFKAELSHVFILKEPYLQRLGGERVWHMLGSEVQDGYNVEGG